MNSWKTILTRPLLVAVVAMLTVASLATYEFASAKPARASGAAPAAAPLDDNSVGALLSLDHAMETLAARVTPAVVNVTVVSKSKETAADEGGMPDMQQFFVPNGPFGQQGQQFGRQFRYRQQPENRIER